MRRWIAFAALLVTGCAPEPRTARQAILANVREATSPRSVEIVAGPRDDDGRIFRAYTRDGTFVLRCDSYEDLVCDDDVGRILSRDGDYAPEGCHFGTFWSCDDLGWEAPDGSVIARRAKWGSFKYFF